ncbi:MAG TPA: sortase [Bacilli bacterium]|nr:sortase [Bacilli bacterium]
MKKKIINIIIILLVLVLYFFVYSYIYDNFRERKRQETDKKIVDQIDDIIANNTDNVTEKKVKVNNIKYTVLGKISIKRINFYQSILKENTFKSLNVSVVKIAGPNLNMVGNVVIGGHNYMRKEYFYGIRKLRKGDIIKITDLTGISIYYKVEYGRRTTENDESYFKASKKNTKELTLVTCVPKSKYKYYVKAYEK